MATQTGYRFIDEVRVEARSGAGGSGLVSFRREKFVPKGGPSGGNGGRGGQVVFVATGNRNTLHHLRFSPHIRARRGRDGGPNRRTGARGEDAVVEVPVGTLIKDIESERVLADLSEDGARYVALEGGHGGRGNASFTSSTHRAPDFATSGGEARESTFQLELKLLADVGLVGLPNAGKSTLVRRLSAARPRVAAYPFTTLEPSLGVVQVPGGWETFVVADIPGLVEGVAEGAGLGHQFLRHVERCAVLLHALSLDPVEADIHGDVLHRHDAINAELARFEPALAKRPQIVLLSKSDLVPPQDAEALRVDLEARGLRVFVGSAATGEGLDPLIFALHQAVERVRQEAQA